MNYKITIMFLAITLAACVQTNTANIQNTAVAIVQTGVALTQTALPTATLPPPTFMPTTTPLPKFPLEGYVMLFTKDGDLYFQDGENTPVKLTHIGEKAPSPILSDDNKKVVFFRETTVYNKIFSINTDGSQEQVIVANRVLPENMWSSSTQSFVPNTHLLIFHTFKCELQNGENVCIIEIFKADTDTGEIKIITSNTPGQYKPDGNFKVSPDGKMISVSEVGHLDIFNLEGKLLRANILPYFPSDPPHHTNPNSFPIQNWLLDSTGLIVALPNITAETSAFGEVPAFTIWRYTLESNTAAEIPLDPSPMNFFGAGCDEFQVSADGKWILYGGGGITPLYIGSLMDGHVQIIDTNLSCPKFSWSSDNVHFLYGNSVGAVDKLPLRLNGIPLNWIDANHFTYLVTDENSPKTITGEIDTETIKTFDSDFADRVIYIIKLK